MSKSLKDIFPIILVQYILNNDEFCTYMFLELCKVVELRIQNPSGMAYQLSFIDAFFNSIPNYDVDIYPDRSNVVESFIDILKFNCYNNTTNPTNHTITTNHTNPKKRRCHTDKNPTQQKRMCM
jgi:hypothetical protein